MVCKDFEVRKGNTFIRRFRFKNTDGTYVNLSSSHLTFYVGTPARVKLRKTTEDGSMARISDTEVELALTAEETRLFRDGRGDRYELELKTERTQVTLLDGFIIGTGGVNED